MFTVKFYDKRTREHLTTFDEELYPAEEGETFTITISSEKKQNVVTAEANVVWASEPVGNEQFVLAEINDDSKTIEPNKTYMKNLNKINEQLKKIIEDTDGMENVENASKPLKDAYKIVNEQYKKFYD